MATMPDNHFDMVLVDLPYGMTDCKWDTVIDLEDIWTALERICKPGAAMVFTAAQPFTSALIMSNIKNFKYCWYWNKSKATGHLNAKKQPMRNVEDIVVFYNKPPTYNPQMKIGTPYKAIAKSETKPNDGIYRNTLSKQRTGSADGSRYPTQTLHIQQERGFHPTQKPVDLFRYLIRTYTNEGDRVLDFTAGSCTTGVAADSIGRKFVCIEKNEEYYNKSLERFPYTLGRMV